jgi:hypothetical protein
LFGCSGLGVAYRLHRINRDLENAVNVTQSAGVA